MTPILDLQETDVHLMRKIRLHLQVRADCRHRSRRRIVRHQNRMGITHRDDRQPNVPDGRRHAPQGVFSFSPRFVPGCIKSAGRGIQDGHAHIDRHAAVRLRLENDAPRFRVADDARFVREPRFAHKHRKTPGPVAAHFHFAAVCVENPILKVSPCRFRLFHHQKLIEPDAETAVGKAADIVGRETKRRFNSVYNHKVVACALHFDKRQNHASILSFNTPKVRPRAAF